MAFTPFGVFSNTIFYPDHRPTPIIPGDNPFQNRLISHRHASGHSNLGLVLRLSQLRRLDAVGVASIERRRLPGRAPDWIRCVRGLVETKFQANFPATFLEKIETPISPALPARISDFGGDGFSGRRVVCTKQL